MIVMTDRYLILFGVGIQACILAIRQFWVRKAERHNRDVECSYNDARLCKVSLQSFFSILEYS